MNYNTQHHALMARANEVIAREDQEIARRLVRFRKDMGVSASDFAEVLHMSEQEILDYELGYEPVPASLLMLISAAFEIDVNYFYQPAVANASQQPHGMFDRIISVLVNEG